MARLWDPAWEEFIPFLDYDIKIRTVLCSTNAMWVFRGAAGAGCQPRYGPPGRPALTLNAIRAWRL